MLSSSPAIANYTLNIVLFSMAFGEIHVFKDKNFEFEKQIPCPFQFSEVRKHDIKL